MLSCCAYDRKISEIFAPALLLYLFNMWLESETEMVSIQASSNCKTAENISWIATLVNKWNLKRNFVRFYVHDPYKDNE